MKRSTLGRSRLHELEVPATRTLFDYRYFTRYNFIQDTCTMFKSFRVLFCRHEKLMSIDFTGPPMIPDGVIPSSNLFVHIRLSP